MTKEFDPDWTLAPAAYLRDWMDENGLTPAALARQCGRGEADIKASLIIEDALGREPLLESHAGMLERGTGISAQFWLTLESNYRADLAAGRKDMTPEGGIDA
jgi:plasmid maintenance system antidote protein VapI